MLLIKLHRKGAPAVEPPLHAFTKEFLVSEFKLITIWSTFLKLISFQVWTEEGEEESEMTCSERLQAELQDDPGGGPPLIPLDPPDPPGSPREQDLTGNVCRDLLCKCVSKKLGLRIQFVRHQIAGWLTFSVYL